jgi:two-component system phosphate regulon sensor histidine kinase PhoR
LDNAIKYTVANPFIEISTYNMNAFMIISIKDNGIGIPVAYKDKVFDKFFRVSNGDLHDVKGFGLGLYYVKQVIDGHNGKIMIKSKINKGSLFELWLPQ